MKQFILCLVLVFLVNIVAGRAVQKKDEHKAEQPAEHPEDLAVNAKIIFEQDKTSNFSILLIMNSVLLFSFFKKLYAIE